MKQMANSETKKKDDAMDIFEEKSLVARATDIIKSSQAFSRRTRD